MPSKNRTSVCDVVLCPHALFFGFLLFLFFFWGGGGDWSLRMSIPKIFQFDVIGAANNLEAASIKDVFFFLPKFVSWRPRKKWLRPLSENNNRNNKTAKYTSSYIVKSF